MNRPGARVTNGTPAPPDYHAMSGRTFAAVLGGCLFVVACSVLLAILIAG